MSEQFDPFTSPIIRESWRRKIKLYEPPKVTRVWNRALLGKCTVWCGWHNAKPDKAGPYGCVRVDGQKWYIHRYVYSRFHGVNLTEQDIVDHLCRRRLCFNPHHLEHTDHRTNFERGDAAEALKPYRFKKNGDSDDALTDEKWGGL